MLCVGRPMNGEAEAGLRAKESEICLRKNIHLSCAAVAVFINSIISQ